MEKIFNFYGRRKGKGLSKKLQNLVENCLPNIVIKEDFLQVLERYLQYNHKYLEIGFGYGEHLAEKAKNHSQDLFIGAEPYLNGVASLLEKIEEEDIKNIFIFNDDVRKLFNNIPNDFFDGVFVLFPDPWHKKRHNNRRIINEKNLDDIVKFLKKDGFVRFATDDEAYTSWVLNILERDNRFKIIKETKEEGVLKKVTTRYCKKALKQGKNIFYVDFVKV